MKKFLDIFLKLIGNNLSKVICSICDAIKSLFSYKKKVIETNICKEKEQKEKEYCEKIDKVTKEGTLEDLLDLKRK